MSFCFEPIRYVVGRASEPSELSAEGDLISESRSELGAEYFLNKIIFENTAEFETVDIRHELVTRIFNEMESMKTELRNRLGTIVSDEVIELLFPTDSIPAYAISRLARELPSRFFFHKKTPSVILPASPNTLYILSKENEHVKTLVNDIKAKSEQLSSITKDFGLELLGLYTSRDFARSILEKTSKIKKIDFGKPQNELEEKVIKICEKITTAFLPNITIEFEEPPESFECDVFIGLNERTKVIIEPTDYEKVKEDIHNGIVSDTLKNRIILATQDKAQRLKARSIVIVNGFPDDAFLKLKNIADSRGVILMNEKDYEAKLPVELCNLMLSTVIRTRPLSRFLPTEVSFRP